MMLFAILRSILPNGLGPGYIPSVLYENKNDAIREYLKIVVPKLKQYNNPNDPIYTVWPFEPIIVVYENEETRHTMSKWIGADSFADLLVYKGLKQVYQCDALLSLLDDDLDIVSFMPSNKKIPFTT